MKVPLPSPASSLALSLVLLGLGGSLLGNCKPLGTRPWQGLQAWWTLQRFHQAAADQDFSALLALGEAYFHATGQGDILDFATYQVAYAAASPSNARLPSEALYWARQGLSSLERNQAQVPNPWTGLQTQAYSLVLRVFPLSHRHQDLEMGLQALADRLAAGGGLHFHSKALATHYQSYLALPQSQRKIFLLELLDAPILDSSQ